MIVYYEKLLSTPYDVIGAVESESFTIDHVFFENQDFSSRFYRRYLVLSLTVENGTEAQSNYIMHHLKPIIIDNSYDLSISDVFRNYLALHFGKIFIDHGVIKCEKNFLLPRQMGYLPIKYPGHRCCNNVPRSDFNQGNSLAGIEAGFNKLLALLSGPGLDVKAFVKALELYYNGLNYYNLDETISFIMFISAIETLIDKYCHDDRETSVYKNEAELRDIFSIIDQYIPQNSNDNKKIKRYILKDKHAISIRFRKTIIQYLDHAFFNVSESDGTVLDIQRDDLDTALKMVYKIRSNYLHDGRDISSDVRLPMSINGAARISPLVFMERVVRYVLMKIFATVLVKAKDDNQ